jgi:hypothetical protein
MIITAVATDHAAKHMAVHIGPIGHPTRTPGLNTMVHRTPDISGNTTTATCESPLLQGRDSLETLWYQMEDERLVWEEVAAANLRYYPNISLEKLRKAMQTQSQNS